MKIIVKERRNDFMVHVEGDITVWEFGRSWEAAVGRLVMRLGLVEIEHVKKNEK